MPHKYRRTTEELDMSSCSTFRSVFGMEFEQEFLTPPQGAYTTSASSIHYGNSWHGVDIPEGLPEAELRAWLKEHDPHTYKFQPCVHYKTESERKDVSITLNSIPMENFEASQTFRLQAEVARAFPGLAEPIDIDPLSTPKFKEIPWEFFGGREKAKQLNAMAFEAMVPSLDSGFDAPLFIFELVELKTLWLSLVQTFGILRRLISLLPRLTLKEIAQTNLAAQFGALPLIRDVRKFLDGLETVGNAVDKFLSQSGKRMTLHWQHALSPEMYWTKSRWNDFSGPIRLSSSGTGANWYGCWHPFDGSKLPVFQYGLRREVVDSVFHATMDFQYELPSGYTAGVRHFLAELDYWNIAWQPSQIWNALPFSFVVDWVWDVGSYVSRLDLDNLPVNVVCYDYCISVKLMEKEIIKLLGIHPNHDLDLVGEAQPSGALERSSSVFIRFPVLPETEYASPGTGFTLPSGNQFLLAASLVLARL